MKADKYSLSFVVGALFHHESVRLAVLYLKKGDGNEVRDEVIARNLLQVRTASSAKRICREICSRLKRLNRDELKLLVEGEHQEQVYLLWIAVCRHHRFIYEFAVEVIRERFLTLKYDLSYEDFDAFYNAKMEWHEELEKIATTTRSKLRQVLFRMLREAEILGLNNAIIPATLTPRLVNVICSNVNQDLYLFPTMETRMQGGVT